MQITRQALYRVAKPRTAPQRRPPADGSVDAAIVEVAKANPTDGYRIVCAWVGRKLGRAVNRKRVLRVMRQQRLIQRSGLRGQASAAGGLLRPAARAAMASRYDLDLGRRARLGLP